jgi:hypothetical protein
VSAEESPRPARADASDADASFAKRWRHTRAAFDRRFDVGPRGGISVNGDQWIVGGYGRYDGFCFGGCSPRLGIELQLLAGFGGNHMTLRASVRLSYVFWFFEEMFGFYPLVGGSVVGYLPIGTFASFCGRVNLEGCSGWDAGLELGGGFHIWRFSLEAAAGLGGIPVVTTTLGFTVPLWRSPR